MGKRKRRLREVEAAMRRERRQARRWLEKHEVTDSSRPHREELLYEAFSGDRWLHTGSRIVGATPSLTPPRLATRAVVQHVLSYLRPDLTELLTLRYGEGKTYAELASHLGCSRQNAWRRVRRAEQEFLRVWSEHATDPLSWKEML